MLLNIRSITQMHEHTTELPCRSSDGEQGYAPSAISAMASFGEDTLGLGLASSLEAVSTGAGPLMSTQPSLGSR